MLKQYYSLEDLSKCLKIFMFWYLHNWPLEDLVLGLGIHICWKPCPWLRPPSPRLQHCFEEHSLKTDGAPKLQNAQNVVNWLLSWDTPKNFPNKNYLNIFLVYLWSFPEINFLNEIFKFFFSLESRPILNWSTRSSSVFVLAFRRHDERPDRHRLA